jgi:hypothetical protein
MDRVGRGVATWCYRGLLGASRGLPEALGYGGEVGMGGQVRGTWWLGAYECLPFGKDYVSLR